MILSLWQGDICTGTFRMPAPEAARLISSLAYGLTEAMSGQGPPPGAPPSRLRQTWSRFLSRLETRLHGNTDSQLRILK